MSHRLCERCGERVAKGHSCKGSAHSRGYDRPWRRFREWFLSKHSWICQDCGGEASEVHHIEKLRDYPELRLHESNCMALCHSCHLERTVRGE